MSNPTTVASLPEIGRPDATFIVARDFSVPRRALQQPGADALLDAWDAIPWPEGLLSISVYLGSDGLTVFHYVQWTDQQAYQHYIASGAPGPAPYIVQNAPEMKMGNVAEYSIYRSVHTERESLPGCIVAIDVAFEGPDHQRLRDWVDTVIAALEHDEGVGSLPVGGLGAYFHVSLDGTRVLNYAEWESEETHEAALQAGGGQSIGASDPWERVRTYPGLKGFGFRRFVPYRTRSAPDGSTEP